MVNSFALRWLDSTRGARASDCQRSGVGAPLVRGRRACPVRGLRLEAVDTGISLGEGDVVRGNTVALIMAMTGRSAYCAELAGPGVAELEARSS